MKLLAKTFPVLLFQFGSAQTPMDYSARKIDYGYSTSTFSGITLNNMIRENNFSKDPISKNKFTEAPLVASYNYGWKQGLFLWINLSPCHAYRPEVNATFGITTHKIIFPKTDRTVYSTFFGLEFKPQLIIRIGCRDTEPVIRMAPNMSYYLTSRQSYLIVGPKFSYQQSDKTFLKHNSERKYKIGALLGIGVDNLFPNLDVAPELIASVEYQPAHIKEKGSTWFYTSLSLVVNVF